MYFLARWDVCFFSFSAEREQTAQSLKNKTKKKTTVNKINKSRAMKFEIVTSLSKLVHFNLCKLNFFASSHEV